MAQVWRVYQQKHPTQTNDRWDFHWHPGELPVAAKDLLSKATARVGTDRGALLLVSPQAIAWLRTFESVTPHEQRRYYGLAGSVAMADSADASRFSSLAPGLLAAMVLPPATAAEASDSGAPTPLATGILGPATVREELWSEAGIAREHAQSFLMGLLSGADVEVLSSHREELPQLVGRALAWLPKEDRLQPRIVRFTEKRPAPVTISPAQRTLAHYLALSLQASANPPPQADPVQVWRALAAVCAARGLTAEALFGELIVAAAAWNTTDGVLGWMAQASGTGGAELRRAVCVECGAEALSGEAWRTWRSTMYLWGRGYFAREPDVEHKVGAMLAKAVCDRWLLEHLRVFEPGPPGLTPGRDVEWIREGALMPAAAVDTVFQLVRKELPTAAAEFQESEEHVTQPDDRAPSVAELSQKIGQVLKDANGFLDRLSVRAKDMEDGLSAKVDVASKAASTAARQTTSEVTQNLADIKALLDATREQIVQLQFEAGQATNEVKTLVKGAAQLAKVQGGNVSRPPPDQVGPPRQFKEPSVFTNPWVILLSVALVALLIVLGVIILNRINVSGESSGDSVGSQKKAPQNPPSETAAAQHADVHEATAAPEPRDKCIVGKDTEPDGLVTECIRQIYCDGGKCLPMAEALLKVAASSKLECDDPEKLSDGRYKLTATWLQSCHPRIEKTETKEHPKRAGSSKNR